MNPAFSVIFLTTLIGMGQGLFLAIYTQQVYSVLDVVQKVETGTELFFSIASAVSLLLLVFVIMKLNRSLWALWEAR